MRKFLIFCLFFALISSITGCYDIEPADAETGKYATMNAGDVGEYTLFMTRELSYAASLINSRTIAAQSASSYENEAELVSAKQSLQDLNECIDVIKTTVPAKTYESSRETSLVILDAAKQHLVAYIDDLEAGKDVSEYSTLFSSDFNEITSQANTYNQ